MASVVDILINARDNASPAIRNTTTALTQLSHAGRDAGAGIAAGKIAGAAAMAGLATSVVGGFVSMVQGSRDFESATRKAAVLSGGKL